MRATVRLGDCPKAALFLKCRAHRYPRDSCMVDFTGFSGITALGLAAAVISTFTYLPQLIKTWRTRSTGDISLGMFLFACTSTILWLGYGILLGDLPLIAANGITLFFSATILYFKLRYR